jgi:hypothetical protein
MKDHEKPVSYMNEYYYDDDDDEEDDDDDEDIIDFHEDFNKAGKSLFNRPRSYSDHNIQIQRQKPNRKPGRFLPSHSGAKPSDLVRYPKPNPPKSNSDQETSDTDVHYFFIFLFFLFVAVITFTQLIIMHGMGKTNSSTYDQMKAMHEELKQMDLSIDKMIKEEHVLPMHMWRPIKSHLNNIDKFRNKFIRSYIENNEYLNKKCNEKQGANTTNQNTSLGVYAFDSKWKNRRLHSLIESKIKFSKFSTRIEF